MNINGDFGQRVNQSAETAEWMASPLPGVTRRMLDRVGGEVARATSVVRYAPGSRFSAHVHGGGEEFLVLEGVFSDEHADFPAGHYVRNPPGTSHAPHSQPGCVILVKLWQFAADDLSPVQVDTHADHGWQPEAAGVERLPLHAHDGVVTAMLRLAPQAQVPLPADGFELYLLEGRLHEGPQSYAADTWMRCPAGTQPAIHAGTAGARLYLKSGGVGRSFMPLPALG